MIVQCQALGGHLKGNRYHKVLSLASSRRASRTEARLNRCQKLALLREWRILFLQSHAYPRFDDATTALVIHGSAPKRWINGQDLVTENPAIVDAGTFFHCNFPACLVVINPTRQILQFGSACLESTRTNPCPCVVLARAAQSGS